MCDTDLPEQNEQMVAPLLKPVEDMLLAIEKLI